MIFSVIFNKEITQIDALYPTKSHGQALRNIHIDGWHQQIEGINDTFAKIGEGQLMNEIAPSKNRGIYLLGHLTAVHDLMLPLMRFEKA